MFREIGEDVKPRITIKQAQLPEIKDWEIGKEYTLQVKVVLKSKGQSYWSNVNTGDFEIQSAKAVEDDKVKQLKERYKR